MSDSASVGSAPTYGNWRRPRSPGLWRLGTGGTVAFFAGAVVVVIGLAASLRVGVTLLVLVVGGLAPLLLTDRWGRTGYERAGERAAWVAHRRAGRHLYRTGPLARSAPATARLPGLAAALEVSEARDAHGRPFVVLDHPHTGHVATVLECAPPGDALVDGGTVDQLVAGWGAWLGGLSHEAGLVAAAVTVESAPDTGIRLRRAVERRLDPEGPAMALATMREIVDTFPAGAAAATCRITLTWSRSRSSGRRRPVEDLVTDIGARLPELSGALSLSGAGAVRPMTAESWARGMRVAYDPCIASAVEEAGDEPAVAWDDCGPHQAEERAGSYLHDGATSITWVMGEAPRGAVRSGVLRRLLEPHREIDRKRVTILYRPYAPQRAAQLVDSDVRDATWTASQKAQARARDSVEVRSAVKAAEEEALGAGLIRFGMIVTATVTGENEDIGEAVSRCESVVEHLGGAARIQLRRAWRSQATTFLAGLPAGLVLPAHVNSPGEWRDHG